MSTSPLEKVAHKTSDSSFASIIAVMVAAGIGYSESQVSSLKVLEREAARCTVAVQVATLASSRYQVTVMPSEVRNLLTLDRDIDLKARLREVRNAMVVWDEMRKAGAP